MAIVRFTGFLLLIFGLSNVDEIEIKAGVWLLYYCVVGWKEGNTVDLVGKQLH